MRKPVYAICEQQILTSAFVIRCHDSIIPLLSIPEISILFTWAKPPKTGFLTTWLILFGCPTWRGSRGPWLRLPFVRNSSFGFTQTFSKKCFCHGWQICLWFLIDIHIYRTAKITHHLTNSFSMVLALNVCILKVTGAISFKFILPIYQ